MWPWNRGVVGGFQGTRPCPKELRRHPARIVTMVAVPIPHTTMIGVWRIEPSGHYALVGLMDDPIVTAAAEQARKN